jgi:[calcium/calmodulin-dependent protein kinase] kinase
MDPSVSDRLSDQKASEARDALFLIREEIAIMKKLDHPNLVSLIEVLDDPEEDSLYMVLEMCKKGVIMKVGLDQAADPYEEEECRCWFRDLILGIEYCALPLRAEPPRPGGGASC